MNISMTSDYATGLGCPEPHLRRIADAGFTHVHWCHQWNTDFLYSRHEIDQIATWLTSLGLAPLDLHGSAGQEKRWVSPREYERLAGCELVENRIDMAARLGADVVIMHTGAEPDSLEEKTTFWTQLRKSLDELRPVAASRGVRIAIENGGHDDFSVLRTLFGEYEPEYVGLCYDSGHGNMGGRGPAHLGSVRDRLISVHLHDNDGSGDQHRIPFEGTIDWQRLTLILATSSYAKCISLEVSTRQYEGENEATFLHRAKEKGDALAQMLDAHRRAQRG